MGTGLVQLCWSSTGLILLLQVHAEDMKEAGGRYNGAGRFHGWTGVESGKDTKHGH